MSNLCDNMQCVVSLLCPACVTSCSVLHDIQLAWYHTVRCVMFSFSCMHDNIQYIVWCSPCMITHNVLYDIQLVRSYWHYLLNNLISNAINTSVLIQFIMYLVGAPTPNLSPRPDLLNERCFLGGTHKRNIQLHSAPHLTYSKGQSRAPEYL